MKKILLIIVFLNIYTLDATSSNILSTDSLTNGSYIDPLSTWLSFGTNLDFINKSVKNNELYADFGFNFNNIIQFYGVDFSIAGGFIQNKSISSVDTISEQFRQIDATKIDTSFKFNYKTTNSSSILLTSREVTSFYIEPKLKAFHFEDSTTRLDFILHFEFSRINLVNVIQRNYVTTQSDTIPDSWPRPYNTIENLPKDKSESEVSEHNINVGTGFDFRAKNNYSTVLVKGLLGFNHVRYFNTITPVESQIILTNPMFYYLKLEIMERYSGIKIGSETRGYMNFSKDKVLNFNRIPNFTIYIAKTISFSKIQEIFTL